MRIARRHTCKGKLQRETATARERNAEAQRPQRRINAGKRPLLIAERREPSSGAKARFSEVLFVGAKAPTPKSYHRSGLIAEFLWTGTHSVTLRDESEGKTSQTRWSWQRLGAEQARETMLPDYPNRTARFIATGFARRKRGRGGRWTGQARTWLVCALRGCGWF